MASYKTTLTDTTNVSIGGTYTFTAVDIGTASANRVVVVGQVAPSGTNNTITVGGTSCTLIVKNGAASLYAAKVASGATADIIVTVASASCSRIALPVWVGYTSDIATGLDSGATNAGTTSSAVVSDIEVAPGGFLCAVGTQFNTSGSTLSGSWSGTDSITENVDSELEGTSIYGGYLIASTTQSSTTGDFTLTASLSGSKQAAVVSFSGIVLSAAAGSYSLTGTASTPLHGFVLGAASGSYALTGTAATPTYDTTKKIIADAGSYSLTGSSASLLHGWLPSAGSGSYSLTGSAATAVYSKILTVDSIMYTLTGSDADSFITDRWTPATDSQTPAWSNDSDTQTPAWTPVDDTQTPNWS